MDRQQRVQLLTSHKKNPSCYGLLEEDKALEATAGNPGCGDVIRISVLVDEQKDVVTDIGWTGKGCTISQAAASLMAEQVEGLSCEELLEWSVDEIELLVGTRMVAVRPKCALLALGVLKRVLKRVPHRP